MSYMLTTLSKKIEVDSIIKDTIDKVLVLRFGRASDPVCLQLDQILSKAAREVSKFATVALVDVDSQDIQVYVKYFDITLIPSTVFFFNAHHMKMDSGTADHTKWIGAFHKKQDFIDVVEAIFRGAMKGKLIVNCPLPPERSVCCEHADQPTPTTSFLGAPPTPVSSFGTLNFARLLHL
ncbi:Thioredoxin-like superfamily [Sesbania bispinosa]|nr:Thioredoxin-like superfamily [Sesbania bispinosa]